MNFRISWSSSFRAQMHFSLMTSANCRILRVKFLFTSSRKYLSFETNLSRIALNWSTWSRISYDKAWTLSFCLCWSFDTRSRMKPNKHFFPIDRHWHFDHWCRLWYRVTIARRTSLEERRTERFPHAHRNSVLFSHEINL